MFSLTKNNELESDIYSFKPFKITRVGSSDDKQSLMSRVFYSVASDSANLYFVEDCESNVDLGNMSAVATFPQELWRFNFASRKLYRFQEFTMEIDIKKLLIHRNLLICYGRTNYLFRSRSHKLCICRMNGEGGKIVPISTLDVPLSLNSQALICHDNYLYAIGEQNVLIQNLNIHRLNLETFVWETVYLSNEESEFNPKRLCGYDVAFDGVRFYIFGGLSDNEANDLSSILTFDLKTLEWNKLELIEDPTHDFPWLGHNFSAVQINTGSGIHIFIMFEEYDYTFPDLWKLDLNNFQWTKIVVCQMPRLLHCLALSATPEGKLSMFAKVWDGDLPEKSTNVIYTTWLCIPKLSEICWDAVLAYSPHLTSCSSKELVSLGIPARFVSKISNK